jgi:hypothetical protein
MKIPSRFKLFGQTITVVVGNHQFIDQEGTYGEAHYRKDTIYLRPPSEVVPVTKEMQEHSFLHELTHFLLYNAEDARNNKVLLHSDEGFVDLFSHLLHQALTTMEYDD